MSDLKGVLWGVITLIVGIVLLYGSVVNQDAGEILVIQYLSGELEVHTEPGLHAQWFGKVTRYPRQKSYEFDKNKNEDKDTSITLQFNDGGKATLHGSVNWEMPLDKESIIRIHKQFNSAEGVETRAVVKMMDAATYLAGPLMSSIESAGERRSELVNVINDQASRGVYVTRVVTTVKKDDLTKEEKTINMTEIQRNSDGSPKRQQGSLLADFNIKLQPISIKLLDYDDIVKKQIKDRQHSTTAVQLAIAQALKAEQDAITAEKNGMASAAEAKWKQETIKAQQVTEAEQKRDVAKLAKEEAEFYKQQQILMGEGDAKRKELVMKADGALEPKLEAYKVVQGYWANAFAKYQGNMVPQTVMGNGSNGQTSAGNAQSLVDLLTAKTAKDLALDKTVTSQ